MSGKTVSIILPCYNEAQHLENSIRILTEHSLNFNFPFEFIFVEDKSSDATRDILKRLEPAIKNAQFIYHDKNRGRGAAVKSGFKAAKGEIIGYIDIDLEVSPRYINSFVDSLKENDVAVGNRKYFSNMYLKALIRNTFSNCYRALNKKMLKHAYNDTESGYKFFRKEALVNFFNETTNDHWFWDTEFMMYCFCNKLKVIEIDVEFLRDENKHSTVKVISDSIHYFKELMKYRKNLRTK